jgi:hypothetical protein
VTTEFEPPDARLNGKVKIFRFDPGARLSNCNGAYAGAFSCDEVDAGQGAVDHDAEVMRLGKEDAFARYLPGAEF